MADRLRLPPLRLIAAGAILLLVALAGWRWISIGYVQVQWRLPPRQESIIVSPALGGVQLSSGQTLVQTFTAPAEPLISLKMGVAGYTGEPAMTWTLRNGTGGLINTWTAPVSSTANNSFQFFLAGYQAPDGKYSLSIHVLPAGVHGSEGGTVTFLAEEGPSPAGSAMTLDGRRAPQTLGLMLTFRVLMRTQVDHYPSLVAHLWPDMASAALTISLHVLYVLGLAAILALALLLAVSPRRIGFALSEDDMGPVLTIPRLTLFKPAPKKPKRRSRRRR